VGRLLCALVWLLPWFWLAFLWLVDAFIYGNQFLSSRSATRPGLPSLRSLPLPAIEFPSCLDYQKRSFCFVFGLTRDMDSLSQKKRIPLGFRPGAQLKIWHICQRLSCWPAVNLVAWQKFLVKKKKLDCLHKMHQGSKTSISGVLIRTRLDYISRDPVVKQLF
jgi:hypothetical protein